MPEEFARLPLQQEIPTKTGALSQELVVYRPTCRGMTEVLDANELQVQIGKFVKTACRALNGGTEPLEFDHQELTAADSAELGSILSAMSDEADEIELPSDIGDGIKEPLVYTLQRPIHLTPNRPNGEGGGEVLTQILFEARKIKDLTEYLDASRGGETKEFHAFMRSFGKPLGIAVPLMSDAIIDAMDFIDYVVIRRKIMGKFISSRKRWKRSA